MIANAANAFAQALETDLPAQGDVLGATDAPGDGEQPTGTHGAHAHAAARPADPKQGRLLALADALGDVPRPTLSAEAKVVQRAQLIAAMEAALADGSFGSTGRVPEQRDGRSGKGAHRATGLHKLRPRSRWSRRLAVGGLSVGVAAGALGGVAAASTDALPGDTLYGLKRGMEDLRLDLANDDADRGKVYLDLASTRMQEVRRLMERGRSGDLDSESLAEVRKALSGMRQEVAEGHRLLSAAYLRDGSLAPMETLSTFSDRHRKNWSELRGRLPAQLNDVGDQVTSVFDAMDHEVAPLRGALAETSGRDSSPGGDRGTGTGTDQRHSGRPAPSSSGSRSTGSGDGQQTGKASPSSSGGSTDDGLLGGSDGLVDTPTPTSSASGSSSTTDSTDPEVTLPPLLPGVLPGLGLGVEDTNE